VTVCDRVVENASELDGRQLVSRIAVQCDTSAPRHYLVKVHCARLRGKDLANSTASCNTNFGPPQRWY